MERFNTNEPLDVVEVDGHPYLFAIYRIDRNSIPKAMVAYDVRHDDECQGDFAEVNSQILVNHWGTIIGFHKLPNHYICNEFDGNFNGQYLTAKEFINEYGGNYGIH